MSSIIINMDLSRIWNSRVILRQKKITHTLINAQASTFQTRIVLWDQFQIELESKDIDNIRQKLVKDTLGIPQTQKIDDWIKGKLAKDPNSDIQVKTIVVKCGWQERKAKKTKDTTGISPIIRRIRFNNSRNNRIGIIVWYWWTRGFW